MQLAATGDPEAMKLDEEFLKALEFGMPAFRWLRARYRSTPNVAHRPRYSGNHLVPVGEVGGDDCLGDLARRVNFTDSASRGRSDILDHDCAPSCAPIKASAMSTRRSKQKSGLNALTPWANSASFVSSTPVAF